VRIAKASWNPDAYRRKYSNDDVNMAAKFLAGFGGIGPVVRMTKVCSVIAVILVAVGAYLLLF